MKQGIALIIHVWFPLATILQVVTFLSRKVARLFLE
jgi:hypothetical protein